MFLCSSLCKPSLPKIIIIKPFKGLLKNNLFPNIKILKSFVISNPFDFFSFFFSVKHKRRCLAECPSCSFSYSEGDWSGLAQKQDGAAMFGRRPGSSAKTVLLFTFLLTFDFSFY